MRIKINFESKVEKVPNNVKLVNGLIYKCLGDNNEFHGKPSDYNFSSMCGGYYIDRGNYAVYPNGGFIVFSTSEDSILNILLPNLYEYKSNHIKITGIEFMKEDFFGNETIFKTFDSGIALKKDNRYLTFKDEDFLNHLKEKTLNKYLKINPKLNVDGFDIKLHNTKNKIYRVNIGRNFAITNNITMKINGSKELKKMIYNYGLGKSTGSGFGCVYDLSDYKNYYNKSRNLFENKILDNA